MVLALYWGAVARISPLKADQRICDTQREHYTASICLYFVFAYAPPGNQLLLCVGGVVK